MLTIFQIYGYFKFLNTVQNSRMPEIIFLILEKTFENFLRRRFRCLKEKENEIFEENVMNCFRENFN